MRIDEPAVGQVWMLVTPDFEEMQPSVLLELWTPTCSKESLWRCLCLATGKIFHATPNRWSENMDDIRGERLG